MALVADIKASHRGPGKLTLAMIAASVGVEPGTARRWSNGSQMPDGPRMAKLLDLRNGRASVQSKDMGLTPMEAELLETFRALPDEHARLAHLIKLVREVSASQRTAALPAEGG